MLLVSATSLSSRILVRTDRQFDLKYEIIMLGYRNVGEAGV